MPLPVTKSRMATSLKDYITLFYGPPGVGKTTFVDRFGKVLFLSTDRGTRFLDTMRVECMAWIDFERTAKELEARGAPKYDFICVDHVDDMASMAEDQVCKGLGIDALGDAGYGKGWKAYKNYLEGFVRRMMRLNTGVVFIAHEEIKTVKTRSIELQRVMPAMGKSAWRVIVPLADIIGYCGFRTLKNPSGTKEVRVLETVPREDLYAKDRTTTRRKPSGDELLDGALFIASFGDSVTSTTSILGDHNGRTTNSSGINTSTVTRSGTGKEEVTQGATRGRGRRARS